MTGVVHGRFQILHHDHMKYILAGAEKCNHLIVGITNPDPGLTRQDDADPARSTQEANPLTYWERHCMITDTLIDAGHGAGAFSVVPFPVNLPDLYANYVPLDATFFLTIYDAWGQRKMEMFQKAGLTVDVLWRRAASEKGITSTQVRKAIALGQAWEHLVPGPVAAIIRRTDIMSRLRQTSTPI